MLGKICAMQEEREKQIEERQKEMVCMKVTCTFLFITVQVKYALLRCS